MSRQDLLDEQEMAGLTGTGMLVPPGENLRSVIPEAIATATPDPNAAVATATGAAPTVGTNAAGQPELKTDAIDTSLHDKRTGYDAASGYRHSDTNDLLKDQQKVAAANALYSYGMGTDEPAGAADASGVSRTGLPTWYHNAKLRGDRIPGSKNSHYVLDEATWEPPKEQRIGKGIANMIANMSTAGSRLAMGEKERPLGLRMKDAKRVALGEGAASLADMFIDRKNLRYQDLLKTAKEESEIEKNRAAGTKGAKGSGSQASRMAALTGVLGANATQNTGERLEKSKEAEAAQAMIDTDPRHPKAEEFRRHILESTGGWLNENDVPHASYAELVRLETRFGEEAARRSAADVKRIERDWQVYMERHGKNEAAQNAFKAQQEEIAKQRRDNWLEAGEFWRSGSPPKDEKIYQKVREYHAISNGMMEGLDKLSEIQQALTKMGPLYGAGGEVIKLLGEKLGMKDAQYLTNLGFQLAASLRNLIRKKENFGVPQQWEQDLLRTQVLEPGTFMSWLQGTSSFDSLYALTKMQARQWLRDEGGIGFTDTDKEPPKYTGVAPVRISEPIVRDRHGQPLKDWAEIADQGRDQLEQMEQFSRRLTDEEVKATGWKPGPRGVAAQTPARAPAERDPATDAAAAAAVPAFKAVADHMTKGTRELYEEIKHLKAEDWTPELAKAWKERAIELKDKMLQAFTNMPFEKQLKDFFGAEAPAPPHMGTIEVSGPEVRDKPKPNALPNKPAEPESGDKKPTRWRITMNGRPFATKEKIPDGASPKDANAAFQKGLLNVPEDKRGDFGLEAY